MLSRLAGRSIMITNIEDYFSKGCGRCSRFETPACSTVLWSQGLRDLRRMCRDAGLIELVKWGHPCYSHVGRNIVMMGAFRSDFRLTFFNAALMQDPKGILEKQGPNTREPNMIRFTNAVQVADAEQIIQSYLAEAMGYAQAGVRPREGDRNVDLPEELIAALDDDPKLAKAFRALTPGRQKSYAIHLGSAKTSATRIARIAKCRGNIFAGKGALER